MAYGSCNSERWRVQQGAGPFSHCNDGANLEQNRLESFVRTGDVGTSMRQQRAGDVWNWEYPGTELGAYVWVGLDADGALQVMWEAEGAFNPMFRTSTPIWVTNPDGRECLPGGSYLQIYMPDESVLSVLETEIEAAIEPSWVAASQWSGNFETTAYLLEQLFLEAQARGDYYYGRYRKYTDYTERSDISLEAKQHLTLLWLRAASMILCDHAEITMIPLAMTRFTVDFIGIVNLK
jgi:hypothetical protein